MKGPRAQSEGPGGGFGEEKRCWVGGIGTDLRETTPGLPAQSISFSK